MTNDYNNDEHNGHDEFVEHELTDAEKPHGVAGNLAEAWRTKPFFKFMVLLIAVFAVGVAGFSFLGGASQDGTTHLSRPPTLKEAPGGQSSAYVKQQTVLANEERANQAIASGGSAIPTPIGQPSDEGNFDGTNQKDDPLKELRQETLNLRKANQATQAQLNQVQQQQVQKPPEQFDDSLAQAMQNQMKQLMEGWSPKGIKQVVVIKPEDLKAEEKGSGTTGDTHGINSQNQPPAIPVVNAGTVSYAQLLTEANSDVPGPIMAQIVSGPLAGSRAIGGFQVSQGYEKYLVLKFTIADKKGTDYQINAIALDPNTTLGGMATEVDERYFVRVVLPAAAGFLQGMGQALGQGNASVTTDGTTTISTTTGNGFRQGVYTGMGQAANTAGQFFQDQANLTKPLVRVAAGTPMGIFFVSPVYDPSVTNGGSAPSGAYANQQGYSGANTNMYGPTTYPGQTVAGYGGIPGGGIQQNIAAGLPYPNYAAPQGSYQGLGGGLNATGAGYNNAQVQQNIAAGVPYPNYATPGAGYNNLGSSFNSRPYGYPAQ